MDSKGDNFPKIRCIKQKIDSPQLLNLKESILKKLESFNLNSLISKGEKIAITASSRGIKNQALILRTVVDFLKKIDAKPFIIPAMGSHGGGTVNGQLSILNEYGITDKSLGCPIKATMEVVEIGRSEFDTPIFVDKYVARADKIIIMNKINTHSKFVGEVESGLTKMCLIGLGKQHGAKLYHRLIERHSWPRVVSSITKIILEKLPIICGLAIIHNAKNQNAEIELIKPKDFPKKEPELLKKLKRLKAKIPFKDLDLLIVDEMGKNIFGTGMDTEITGRKSNSEMNVKWVFVRDLTEETHGNAQGIGLADFTTKRLVNKIDYKKTYENALTAYRTDSPKIPVHFTNDKDVLKKIFEVAGTTNPSEVRLVWIKNTAELEKFLVSEGFFNEIEKIHNLKFISELEFLQFDNEGFLMNSKKYW